MAISGTHANLFRSLPLPRGGTLLEIGEANWYGDVDPRDMFTPFQLMDFDNSNLFEVAKAFYAATFAPSRIVSIDYNGSPTALRHDLNRPLPLDERSDLVINHGTAEHVFNIAQVFATMHDRCRDGGLMVHESPFTGWIDHGFYCLQPTLFYDLAAANCYEVVLVAIEEIQSGTIIKLESREHVYRLAEAGQIPNNSMLFVALRKRGDSAFKLPHQGYYARTIGEAGARAWDELR